MDRDDDWSENWVRRTDGEIAAAWIDYWSRHHPRGEEAGEDRSWWAADAMMGLPHSNPLRALEICFLIARSTEDSRVIEMLGAGPLEDLLSEDPTFFDAIAYEATTSPILVEALRYMWQSTIPEDVWQKVLRLVGAA